MKQNMPQKNLKPGFTTPNQDWNVVRLNPNSGKRPPTTQQSTKNANMLLQQGKRNQVQITAKMTTGQHNNKHGGYDKNFVQLADEVGDDFHVETTSHKFSVALQQERQKKGWTQKELAQKTGIDHNTIANYERGKAHPVGGEIHKLSRVFGGVKFPQAKKNTETFSTCWSLFVAVSKYRDHCALLYPILEFCFRF